MHEALNSLLDVQELDMQMIQLMRVKKQRQHELNTLLNKQAVMKKQVGAKEEEITQLKLQLRMMEGELAEVIERFKKLEAQQHSIKKVEEFNALNHEMAQAERDRLAKEQRLTEAKDRLETLEAALAQLQTQLQEAVARDQAIQNEIHDAVQQVNKEGRSILTRRTDLARAADATALATYERLFRNKRDRVIVPIENRCCSGCHITLTAQDENLVRKGERLVFCEHCSRIHYWIEPSATEESSEAAPKRRRRSSKSVAAS